MGTLKPLFQTGDVSSGFQSGQPHWHFAEAHVTCYLRLTSGVTPADLLTASMAAEWVSSTYLQAAIGGAPKP